MSRSRRRKLMRVRNRKCAKATLHGVPLASIMLATSPSSFAQAQQPSDALDEIVVTATKRQENLQDVPGSIQALGTEKLEELHVQSFTDYAQYLPSVSIGGGGGGVVPGGSGNWRILMRGVSSDASVNYASTLPTVGTYLDEQPISTITGAIDLHIYDIARIEALAGPQGTLYGASSEAGTVRIITNKPDPSGFAAGYDIKGNVLDHGSPGYTAEGFVNIPLASTAALRMVAWDERDGGYINNVAETRTFPTSGACIANFSPAPAGCTTSPAQARNHFNDTEIYGARSALKVDLSDSWTITPQLMGQDTKTNGIFAYEPFLGDFNTERFYPDESHEQWWDAAMTVEGKVSDFDITYSGAYMRRNVTTQTDYSDYSLAYDVASGFGSLIKNDAGQSINPSQALTSRVLYTKASNELRIASPKTWPVRFIAGLFQQRQLNDVRAAFQIDDLAESSWVTGYPDTWWLSAYERIDRDFAQFGEVAWDIVPDKLTATVGIRYSEAKNSLVGFAGTHNVYASEAATCFAAGSPPGAAAPCINFAGEVDDHAHTPKANLAYHIDKDRMVYATYAEGFRPGGLNRTPGVAPYLPDYLKSYELGWKTTWLDNHVRWNGAFYWENWHDFQFAFQGPNGLNETANGGQARIKGVESDFSWVVTSGLTLSSAFSLMDPKLTENYCGALNSNGAPITNCTSTPDPVTGAVLQSPAGTQLPLTNKFKGNVQARYVFPMGDFKAHIQGAFVYQTSERVDLRTEENALNGGNLPPFGTANFAAGVERSTYAVELYVTNAFDRLGLTNRYTQCVATVCGQPAVRGGAGGLLYDTPIQPRLIGIQYSQKF
jgi:iron complex outermembrane receptor protein